MMDYVESGSYRGCPVRIRGSKPVIIRRDLLGKKKIIIDKSTVESYEVLDTYTSVGSSLFRSKITFKDGRECCVHIYHYIHNVIMRAIA